MNQKTAKMINNIFGKFALSAKKKYLSLSSPERTRAHEKMKTYLKSPDKEKLFKAQILSDVPLEG